MLLRVHMDHEGRRVHHLTANTDMSLTNQHTSVMNRLSQTELEYLRLQSTIHQLCSAQLQNVIQLLLLLRHQTQTSHTTDDSSTLEDAARILLVQSQQFTSSLHKYHSKHTISYLTNLSKNKLHTPNLTLATETILSANTKLLIQTLAFIRTTRSIECKTILKGIRND